MPDVTLLDTITPPAITDPGNAIALLVRLQRLSRKVAEDRTREYFAFGARAQIRYDCACWRQLTPQLRTIARVAVRLRDGELL